MKTPSIKDALAKELKGGKMQASAADAEKFGLTETLTGLGIELTSVEDFPPGESLVVCMPKGAVTPFDDNEEGVCLECGQAVIYRPGYQIGVAKVCIDCAMSGLIKGSS